MRYKYSQNLTEASEMTFAENEYQGVEQLGTMKRIPTNTVKEGIHNAEHDHVDFAINPLADTNTIGRLIWNDDAKTLSIVRDNTGGTKVSVEIGDEIQVRVKNTTGATILNGQPVYTDSALGNTPLIALADGDDPSKNRVTGIMTADIANNGVSYLTTVGLVRDVPMVNIIDPADVSWTVGTYLYLSTVTGKLTKNRPSVDTAVRVGIITDISGSNCTILVYLRDDYAKIFDDIDTAIDALKGTGYTEGSLKTHEDRLDTLEGTGEGSVTKAIDDAVAPVKESVATETSRAVTKDSEHDSKLAQLTSKADALGAQVNNAVPLYDLASMAKVGVGNKVSDNSAYDVSSTRVDGALDLTIKGQTVTNLVDGENVAIGGTVTFASVLNNSYWDSLHNVFVVGTGSDITLTNDSGVIANMMVIDRTASGLTAYTTSMMASAFPTYFAGTKSVPPMEYKTVGKNLFDRSKATLGYKLNTDGTLVASIGDYTSDYMRVAPLAQMVGQNEEYAWFDKDKVFISYGTGTTAITAPALAVYLRISSAYTGIATMQIEQNSIATTYEAYKESVTTSPVPLRSVPAIADTFDVKSGRHTKSVSDDYILLESDIEGISVSGTNIDAVYTKTYASFPNSADWGNNSKKTLVDGFSRVSITDIDMVKSIGKYAESGSRIRFIIAKINPATGSAYTLPEVKTLFAGTVIRYELATPIITQHPPQDLTCGVHLLQTPYKSEVFITDASGQLTTTYDIGTIKHVWAYDVEGEYELALTTDYTVSGNVISIVGAGANVVISVDYYIDTSAPNSRIEYSTPISNQATRLDKLEANTRIYIDIGTGYDYTSILQAMKENADSNTTFLVHSGTYDLVAEYETFYGTDYFVDYAGYATGDVFDSGLFLADGIQMIGIGIVKIDFSYTGANANVLQWFSPINTSQNNILDNITITIGTDCCRYGIHDDFATAKGSNIFRNCIFSGVSHLNTFIGGGFGLANTYIIENCIFDGAGVLNIAYHNNPNAGAINKLVIKDCYCDHAIRGASYGASEEISKMIVTGCRATSITVVLTDDTGNNINNVELTQWNNTIV